MRSNSAKAFWALSQEDEQTVLDKLSATGAQAVVAEVPPKVWPQGWVPLKGTAVAVYRLR